MNFDPRCPRVDVALVFLREDHGLHAGLAGAEGFLVDAADGLHFAGERDLTGDGDVLTERLLFNGREDGAGDGAAGGWAVDISSSDDIDVKVVVGKTLVSQLTESFAMEPAVSLKRRLPLPGAVAGKAAASISIVLPQEPMTPRP